jgi:hypothetical protein
MSEVLAYLSAGGIALWGVAHALPTRAVVGAFGPISVDNRRVITQEWLAEALAMWFIAAIVVITTAVAGSAEAITVWVYRASALMLLAVAALTTATGARTAIVWVKICPVLLTTTAALPVVASWP